MSSVQPPPITELLFKEGEGGKAPLPWILFFNQLFYGDTGTVWTPSFTNLTIVGTPTITGVFYKISKALCYFSATITPATSTSSTAGTTYINNFPVAVKNSGICFAVSGNLGTNSGMIDKTSGRIYVPGWSAVTVPLTIVGLCETN